MGDHLTAVLSRLSWVAVVWAAFLPVAGLYAWLAYRRRVGRGDMRRAACRTSAIEALLAVVTLPVLLVLLRPGGPYSGGLRLIPMNGLRELRGASDADATVQIVGNVAAFAMVGALLPLRWPLRLLDVALAVGSVCIVVETVQLTLLGRVASTDDVLLNVAGALVGAAVTRHWWVARRHRQASGD